jgi:uncharacterized protein (DUF433 family)
MDWTDCPLMEQIPGKMSGAPVVRGTRMRPQDIVGNAEMGADWIAGAHGMRVEDVRTVLDFWADHYDELPLEYISPERIRALGIEDIDWSACPLVERSSNRFGGDPAIPGTPVRTVDLLVHRANGEADLARVYDLPRETVRSVLRYYDQHKRHFAPAV